MNRCQALRRAACFWEEFSDKFHYDNKYVCGKAWTPRIADIVLLHLFSPTSPEPLPAAEVEAKLQGVYQKQNINLLSHYSKAGSFRSFFWGPGPVVRHIEPKDNAWMLLPLAQNYRALVIGKSRSDGGAKTISKKGDNWFWVLRSYRDGEHEAFISLPDETVVLMSSVPSKGANSVHSFVSTEKAHKTFTIYYQDGEATYHYGQKQWDRSDKGTGRELDTKWINLTDSIGYITVNLSQDSPLMVLPEAGVRSALNLHHITSPKDSYQRFIEVALPNQTHEQTEAMVSEIAGAYIEGVMTCLTPNYLVWANFSGREKSVKPPECIEQAGRLKTPPNTVGILQRRTGSKSCNELK